MWPALREAWCCATLPASKHTTKVATAVPRRQWPSVGTSQPGWFVREAFTIHTNVGEETSVMSVADERATICPWRILSEGIPPPPPKKKKKTLIPTLGTTEGSTMEIVKSGQGLSTVRFVTKVIGNRFTG